MPPPCAPVDSVPFTCRACRQPFFLDRTRLREAVDTDRPPPTCGCDAARVYVGSKLTVADHVLLALRSLADTGATGRGAAWTDITVAAWGRAPRRLGLKGHEVNYPDSNRVRVTLTHLKDKGLIESAGECLYRLTPWGQTRAAKLVAGGKK